MYAEIKSENKVLINRLDDGERILLETIYNKSKEDNKEISLTNLTDENGNFGGVMLEVKDKEETSSEESVEAPEEPTVEETNPEED